MPFCSVQSASAVHERERQRQQQVDAMVSPSGSRAPPSAPASGRSLHSPSSPGDCGGGFISRRISLIQEESIEEDEEEMSDVPSVGSSGIRPSRSTDDYLSDDSCDSRSASAERSSTTDSPTKSSQANNRRQGLRPLHSVRSSPQLLNQIFEEGESDDDEDLLNVKRKNSSPQIRHRNTVASPEVLRKYEHRKKRLTPGSRGTSCSSSDASDTDETESRKRKEKLKQRMQRRDSSDHSSDTDGPSGPGGSGGGGRLGGGSGTNGGGHNRDNNRDHDRNSKDRNDENRPSRSKERRHSGGKQNGLIMAKKESGYAEGTNMNYHSSDLGRKLSNLSLGSNISIGSLTSRGSKYLVESSANNAVPCKNGRNSPKDISCMNEENKARNARIIHVRSKDFSDLVEKFTNSPRNSSGSLKEDSLTTSEGSIASIKMRSKSKDNIKTDINRNGLINRLDSEMSPIETMRKDQNVVQTKCCSLV